LLLKLTVAVWFACALITIIAFFLYIRARMAIRGDPSGDPDEGQTRRLADLDRREQRFQSLHFITLALFVLFGVLILVQLSMRPN
jgi:hypothetical protein